MIDLHSRLDAIAGPVTAPSAAQVDDDLARGRQALRRRRTGQVAGSAFAVTALATAVALGTGLSATQGSPTPNAAASTAAGQSGTRLVGYTGAQPKGFTLDKVPEGWEVLADDAYGIILAPKGAADKDRDHSAGPGADQRQGAGISLEGKIGVFLQSKDDNSTPTGTPVQVGDKPGVLRKQDGYMDGSLPGAPHRPGKATTTLFVKLPSGGYLAVQVWDGLGWGQREIVEFAAGIHVLDDAKRSVG